MAKKPKKPPLTPLAREYKSLRERGAYEPLMLQALELMDGHMLTEIQRDCGVTTQTLRNWQRRRTHRPNASTLRFVGRALGFKLDFIKE